MTTSPITITAELLDDLQRKAKAVIDDNLQYGSECLYDPGFALSDVEKVFAQSTTPAVVIALVEHIRSLTERMAYIERNYVGSCFNWDDNGMCVLAVKIGDSVPVTRDFTAVISAAIAQESAENE